VKPSGMELGFAVRFDDVTRSVVYMEAQEELRRYRSSQVDIYVGESKLMDRRHGDAEVTTHRIIFSKDADPSRSRCWHLRTVRDASLSAAWLFSSAKVAFTVTDGKAAPQTIKLSFQGGQHFAEEFMAKLQSALKERAWEAVEPAAKRAKDTPSTDPSAPPPSVIGISGLRDAHKRRLEEQSALAEEAFRDIDSLESHAREMVSLVQRYVSKISKTKTGASSEEEEGSRLDTVMAELGLANPVTKQASGARFHQELAGQLARVIRPTLERAGGILLLSEVYCRYNRARGTDLVSPNDVLEACRLMKHLPVKMALHSLPSGVLVIRSEDHNPAAVVHRLKEYLASTPYVGTADLASAWKVSIPVAAEYLSTAEARGVVCRDDSIHGVRYWLTPDCLLPE
jgi:ESCRT-II complex subunit VPS36